MTSVPLIALCAAIAHFLVAKLLHFLPSNKHSLSTPKEIDDLLGSRTSLDSQLLARALPNARLRRAFGITNTFVSSDAQVHAHFVAAAKSLVSPPGREFPWTSFADAARSAVGEYLPRPSSVAATSYDTVIRMITFHIVLVTLMGADPAELDAHEVECATRAINDLWRMSKDTADIPPHLLDGLNASLHRWLPNHANPLDFIIPAYETLWRVVAVTTALIHQDLSAREVFTQFMHTPTSEQFRLFDEHSGASAEAVIREVLRLYPPTRHIARAVPASLPSFVPRFIAGFLERVGMGGVVKVADIETLQRSELWGPSPLEFDPMRHRLDQSAPEQRRASLLSFGAGRLACVARNWAPQAAGVIVGAVVEVEGLSVVAGKKMGGREGWEGWRIFVNE